MALRNRLEARTYTVGRRFAVGGMGELYEATAAGLDRPICIKRMRATERPDEMRALFLREVAVAASLHHPNVVEVLDAGTKGSELYMVMEWVEGPSLAELLMAMADEHVVFSYAQSCAIVAQIARGLAHAHERALPDDTPLGIVHRDVAPENILLSLEGVPKLVDFGLAKLTGQNLTAPGTIRGRPRSLAPEQARGDRVDARTDVFGLGVVLFELLSGEALYAEEELNKLLHRVVQGGYAAIHTRLPDADPDLIRILETALAVRAEQRFRSAREFERHLDLFRAGRGLRTDSQELGHLVLRFWPKIQAARKTKLDQPGELEGQNLLLPAEAESVSNLHIEEKSEAPTLSAPLLRTSAPTRLRPLTETDPERARQLSSAHTPLLASAETGRSPTQALEPRLLKLPWVLTVIFILITGLLLFIFWRLGALPF